MHGVMGKPPNAATDNGGIATSKMMLLMLVAILSPAHRHTEQCPNPRESFCEPDYFRGEVP